MASRDFDMLQVLGKFRKDLVGSFKPNGSSAPTGVKGLGFTVARTATGTFVVTLQDSYFDYDGAWCHLEDATLGVNNAQFTLEPLANGGAGVAGSLTIKTTVLTVVSSAPVFTATDLAAATNRRVHFGFRLKNTSGNF